MNGFGNIVDNSLLMGSELVQICLGANEIILRFFPDGDSVTCFDVAAFIDSNSFLFEPLVSGRYGIAQMGKTVTAFKVIAGDTAVVTMNDGSDITLNDSVAEYESLVIQFRGRTIVV